MGEFSNMFKQSSQEIYKKVVETVKCKLLGITVKENHNVRSVEAKWMVKYKRQIGIK